MGKTVISVENLSKRYDLGVIGTGTISRDLNRWWSRLRGNPDPYAKIGEVDHGNRQGESILALDDVSFTVEQGDVLGIIGANGAGKSTLLKILSQVTAPTSGEVKIKGRIGSLLEVGTGFHPELTGRDNIYLNGAILGMTQVEVARKFDEIVDFSGVEKFIDTPVKRYSSGMYVRLAFAVAAHLNTEILIVDEVLAVGDAEFQKKCLGKMGDVAHEGRTVLFVSHNMASVETLSENGILLRKGKIVIHNNIGNVVRYYLSQSKIQGVEIKKDSPLIEWFGIKNPKQLRTLTIDKNITIKLAFRVNMSVHKLHIDLEILNKKNNVVIHAKSKFVTDGFNFNSGEIVTINYKIKSPYLAPGNYHSVIYIYSDEGVLLWLENVELLTIKATSKFGHREYYDNITSEILPEYSIEVL
ncbi:MAG: ATP-binding cassette domain-containing protein [Anaerolineaceae bacterium]|nr:ATP-binding cassette domain-containing protein [Anaerolineaceae bacterium]